MTKARKKVQKAYRAKHRILQKKHNPVGKIRAKFVSEEDETNPIILKAKAIYDVNNGTVNGYDCLKQVMGLK